MDDKIKFSIIMAAYNAEKYIREAIDSVIGQTYRNWELIIVDDGSSDGTGLMADHYAKSDVRIIVVHQENSGTASAARNRALELISGDYTQMLDADDYFSKNMLSSYNQIIMKNTPDIIVPNCECFDDNGYSIYKKMPPDRDYSLVLNGITAFKYSLDWSIHGFFCIKSGLIKKIRYDSGVINGDELTTRKLFYNAHKIVFSDEYYFYRKNFQSTTRDKRNSARMYESLITDLNIYRYSVDNAMPYPIQELCADKLVKSILWKELKFIDEKEGYSPKEQEYIAGILHNVYKSTTKKIWRQCEFKYRIFYYVFGSSYKWFEKGIYIFRNSKKYLRKMDFTSHTDKKGENI